MFRQSANNKLSAISGSNSSTKQSSNENSPTTIREIRSRTIGSTATSNARHLLANRRQAASMERLNSGSSSVSTPNNNNDREKGSLSSGSSNSINNSNVSSPLRANAGGGGGLNRTASRVSRFRSAKAVFERLSSSNNSTTKPDKPTSLDKPRGTVASRYAAAAAARAANHTTQSSTTAPRSRLPTGALARSQESGRSNSNIEINKSANNFHSNKSEISQPKPQPRVISNRTTSTPSALQNITAISSSTEASNKIRTPTSNIITQPKVSAQAKPPPKDLIDKIVSEIVSDSGKQDPDPNCTIQDLSNCDISGIPETLDFDRCFQDVEMMTEEEARKLLSRKNSPPSSLTSTTAFTTHSDNSKVADKIEVNESETVKNEQTIVPTVIGTAAPDQPKTTTETTTINSQVNKCKVRFSDDPVKIFDTHAVEDYDRRNDDIDPVAASAEYEIEKSKEREGIKDSDDEDSDNVGAVKITNQFIQVGQEAQEPKNLCNLPGVPRTQHIAPHVDLHDSSGK